MAMIYRRTPHGSGARLTTTIPLNEDAPQRQSPNELLDADNNAKDDDLATSASARGRVVSRWLRCRAWHCGSNGSGSSVSSPLPIRALAPTASPTNALRFRLCQILWQALLVYAFFGLPVLGRILNFCRYLHRFSAASIVTGLLIGFFQDFAIFVQAATVIVLIKALFQPISIQRRLSTIAAASSSSAPPINGSTTALNGTNTNAALAHERYPYSYGGGPRYVHVPVYFPVRTNEYEMSTVTSSTSSSSGGSSESDPLDGSHPTPPKHLTLVASSSSSATSFPWSLSSSTSPLSPAAVALAKTRQCCISVVAAVFLKVVLILATIASVADFCLQVTMHPRLNRAFVEIFFNYMGQFTGSLMDEEVLTPPVVFVWATYVLLITSMTYGFYTDRLPCLPDILFCASSRGGQSTSSGDTSWCCVRRVKRLSAACSGLMHRRSYRKDSSLPLPSSSSSEEQRDRDQDHDRDRQSAGFMKALYRSYWRRKDSDIVILSETSSGLTSSVSAAIPTRSHQRRRRNSSQGHAATLLGLHASGAFGNSSYTGNSSSSSWMKPKSPLGIVLHCIVASVFVTLGALCVSLMVHTSAGALSRSGNKHHTFRIGVDMQLMANPMFSLQTEAFFARKSRIGADHINCTAASATLRATLGKSEVYETADMGNADSCALLWRKTTAYQGETWWDINWNKTHVEEKALEDETLPAETRAETDSTNSSTTTSPKVAARQPNIIVINMESWRYLDVGVLGGAEKKRQFGKSVTPNFDRLSKQGVLYRKHYTQCVQTTRTLLTTLFGMLPSCTETTALKMYGTGLTVRGLPQFLHARGYFNLFWSAVDLTWEYWDKFLLQNGFHKLVDDKKIRAMLHDTQHYHDRDDDHFSWGMHDHLSFDMLLYAIESAKNATTQSPTPTLDELLLTNNSTVTNATLSGASQALDRLASTTSKNASTTVDPTASPSQEPEATKSHANMRGGLGQGDHRTSDPESVGPATVGGRDPMPRTKPTIGWEGLREPYFIDMYTITSHNPWVLPVDYTLPDLSELYTRVNKRYIDSMYFSDDMLGKFIDSMRAKGLMNNTIVIIEGDHGYGRLEHDNNPSIADSAVFDEATHVPFLILADDFLSPTQRGVEVDQVTMQSDLMATIADILGVSEDEPLVQHGVGHSMRRKRGPKTPVRDVDFDVIHKHHPNGEEEEEKDQETERRVVLCNPFNGLTKGVRTEELKYVFNADGSFKVFDLTSDPIEKKPVSSGYDTEQMDSATQAMLAFVSEQVDLNQFLYETNKFTATMPLPVMTTSTPPLRTRATEEAEGILKLEDGQAMTAEPTIAKTATVDGASQADHTRVERTRDDAVTS